MINQFDVTNNLVLNAQIKISIGQKSFSRVSIKIVSIGQCVSRETNADA